MNKKIGLVVLLIVALGLSTLFMPEIKAESQRDKLQEKLNQLKNEQSQTSKLIETAEKQIKNIKMGIKEAAAEVIDLDQQIDATEEKIVAMVESISATEVQAAETAQLLDVAINRVMERDELLKTRVRVLYETGDVSYLEVLLDSKSIGDFLTRMDMMEKVVDSDMKILVDHIADKEEIEVRKLEIENFLEQLRKDYEVLTTLKENLQKKYKEKTVFIASLEGMEEEWLKEEARLDAELAIIAKEMSEINKELTKLKYDGALFTWPLPDSYKITSGYGNRTHPVTGKKSSFHNGIDIGAPQGKNIVAAADGEVILAKYYGTYGNTIMIDHGGIVTLYAHIKNGGIKVKVGDKAKRGDVIAEVGSTGRSTGPHLHFSVIKDGQYLDPIKYLQAKS